MTTHLGKEEYKGWIVFAKKIIKIRNRVEEFEGNVGQFLGGNFGERKCNVCNMYVCFKYIYICIYTMYTYIYIHVPIIDR